MSHSVLFSVVFCACAALAFDGVATFAGAAEKVLVLGTSAPEVSVSATPFSCPDAPPIARSYATPNKYAAGAAQDTKDAVNAAAFQADEREMERYMQVVNDLTTRFLVGGAKAGSAQPTPPGDRRVAACVVKTLSVAAKAGALTGDLSPAAFNLRIFMTPAFGFAYAVAHRATPTQTPDDISVQTWLRALSDPSMKVQGALAVRGNEPGAPHRVNNMYYWTGYGSLVVGVALNDRDRFIWGKRAILTGLDVIDANGFMPPEVARDKQALQYHAFALQPLSMGSFILSANGQAPTAGELAALRRAAERTAQGLQDPQGFAKDMASLAGGKEVPQTDVPKAPPFVPIVLKLLGPSPQVTRMRARIVRVGPGFLGPSPDDLFQ